MLWVCLLWVFVARADDRSPPSPSAPTLDAPALHGRRAHHPW